MSESEPLRPPRSATAPSPATRRILWARAAGRCAVCRSALLPGGAREAPGAAPGRRGWIVRLSEDAGERYDNLVLLCEEHAGGACARAAQLGTAIMGRGTPSAGHLAELKAAHEEWVRLSPLAEHPAGSAVRYDPRYQGVTLLPRVRSGAVLAGLLDGVHSVQYDRDDPGTPDEEELAEAFLRYVRNITEVWNGYDAAEKERVARHLGAQIAGLDRGGLLLFALRYTAEANIAGAQGDWSILRLWLLREDADSGPAKG